MSRPRSLLGKPMHTGNWYRGSRMRYASVNCLGRIRPVERALLGDHAIERRPSDLVRPRQLPSIEQARNHFDHVRFIEIIARRESRIKCHCWERVIGRPGAFETATSLTEATPYSRSPFKYALRIKVKIAFSSCCDENGLPGATMSQQSE